MRIAADITELVGKTPLVYLSSMRGNRPGVLAAKLECFSPTGSIKDRAVLYMLREAEERGRLKPGMTIVEPTSGNAGISLAAFSIRRGYRVVLTMPESTSEQRLRILRAYGAEIVLTPAAEGMRGALKKAQELQSELPNSYMPQQFENPSNPLSHLRTTAQEIWKDTAGRVAAVVAGIGTGGTISGIGRALKRKNPDIHIVGVEPRSLAVLSAAEVGDHRRGVERYPEQKGPCGIEGMGAGFIPRVLDVSVIDEVIAVNDSEARTTARLAARSEGLLAGTSSGATIFAGMKLAEREEFRDKLIIVICPDNGLKYIGTELFE